MIQQLLLTTQKKSALKSGYIAISAALIISVIVIGISITIAVTAIGEGQSGLTMTKGEDTINFVESCVEDALTNIQQDDSYTGTKTVTRPQGTCTNTISANGNNWDIISTNAGSPSYGRTIHVTLTRGSTIAITKWEEQ